MTTTGREFSVTLTRENWVTLDKPPRLRPDSLSLYALQLQKGGFRDYDGGTPCLRCLTKRDQPFWNVAGHSRGGEVEEHVRVEQDIHYTGELQGFMWLSNE